MTDPAHSFALPPPHSIQVEQFLLGWALTSQEGFDEVADAVEMADFYLPAHRSLYGTMLELREAHKPVDSITVLEALKTLRRLDLVGGEDALRALVVASALDADVAECANILRNKATARQVIEASRQMMNKAYDETASGPELVEAMRATATVLERGKSAAPVSIVDMLEEAFSDIDSPVAARGIVSGLTALDDKIPTGFEPGQLILIGARPSMGKTALGVNFALRMIGNGVPVGFMSFEMSRKQMLRRLLAAMAQVNLRHLSGGRLVTEAERAALLDAVDRLQTGCAPLIVDDTSGTTTQVLRAKARAMVERDGAKILFVDHLGLIRAPAGDRTIRSTVDVVSHVSRELKGLAKDLNVPVVAMCQLNREAAKRGGDTKPVGQPTLTDLRDSGSLEQDADIVMLLHRPGYYTGGDGALAQVGIAKQRDGETGTVNLAWAGWCQRFESMAPA